MEWNKVPKSLISFFLQEPLPRTWTLFSYRDFPCRKIPMLSMGYPRKKVHIESCFLNLKTQPKTLLTISFLHRFTSITCGVTLFSLSKLFYLLQLCYFQFSDTTCFTGKVVSRNKHFFLRVCENFIFIIIRSVTYWFLTGKNFPGASCASEPWVTSSRHLTSPRLWGDTHLCVNVCEFNKWCLGQVWFDINL